MTRDPAPERTTSRDGTEISFVRSGALADVVPDARHRALERQDHGPAANLLAPELEAFFLG